MKTLTRIDGWCETRRSSFSRLYWRVALVCCALTPLWLQFALPAFAFSLSAFLLSVRRLTDT